MSEKFDVVIISGGIVGLATAMAQTSVLSRGDGGVVKQVKHPFRLFGRVAILLRRYGRAHCGGIGKRKRSRTLTDSREYPSGRVREGHRGPVSV